MRSGAAEVVGEGGEGRSWAAPADCVVSSQHLSPRPCVPRAVREGCQRGAAPARRRGISPAAKGTGRGGWDGVGLDEGQAHHKWQLYHDERALTRSCEPLDEVYVGQRAQPHAVDEDEGRA